MDIATLLGGILGTVTIFIVMMISGSLLMYWDFLSLVIVLGGSAFSSIMRWPLKTFINGLRVGLGAIVNPVDDPEKVLNEVVELAQQARSGSILALEKVPVENETLAKAVKLAVDGIDPKVIDEILADDLRVLKRRLVEGRGIYEDMGEACPAFGMIGTVIGLIVIMANLTDPSKIGPGLAVALVTTLYGSLMSNMFFIPISKKLKYRGGEEIRNFEIVRTGIRCILDGLNPRLVRERLETLLG